MDFDPLRKALVDKGYSRRTADAKIAHDVILKAMRDAGFHDNLAVKGGVVMSGMTALARRATMDMDVDLLHYSLGETSMRRFVARLDRHSECEISIDGEIADLRQQDYKGKRMYLVIRDGRGQAVRTKVDIGVHTYESVRQSDYDFRVVTSSDAVRLLVNPKEQMFVEKLKSLLRIGPVSTRFKDVYDMHYLSFGLRKTVLRQLMDLFVFKDERMVEVDMDGVLKRLQGIFTNKTFMRRLARPNVAWSDVPAEKVVADLMTFLGQITPRKAKKGNAAK